MSENLVQYDVDGGVATLTLNRADALNALDTQLKEGLLEAVRAAAVDTSVRAVVLTGSGRAFCVGQDLVEHGRDFEATRDSDIAEVWATVRDHYVPIVTSLATMPKPVVAAVNGIAAGAGAAFALACDFRILAESAGFNFGFSAIGLSVDSGLSWTLPRMVGMAKAKELLLMPRTIPAAEAQRLGLATQVVPGDVLLPAALELAHQLAAGPTVAFGAIRRSLAFSAVHDFHDSLEFEAELMAATGSTEDHREAVRSFAAKQPPTFRGR